jgi:signal transduction histidine kinase
VDRYAKRTGAYEYADQSGEAEVRRRLLIALLAFAAVAVTGFAWPLLASTAAERTQRLLIDRTAALDRFAVLAQQGTATGDTTALTDEATAYAELYQEGVLILDQLRRPIVAAGRMSPDDPGLRRLVDGALRNEPGQPLPQLRPWSTGQVVLTRAIGTGTHISGVVALRVSVAAAAADLARGWTVILLGALAAGVGFVLLAIVLARWVLRPLGQLERGVLAVAAGRRGTHVPVQGGPPELRELAVAFNEMSDALAEARDKECQLVADASHQLRNPMAALRLRLDSLAPHVATAAQPGYHSLATEVERLESLLDGLLALAAADEVAARAERADHGEQADADQAEPADEAWCWPDVVVLTRLDAWRAAARQADVHLVDELPADHHPAGPVACAESELAQVLDVLVDNAIRYGGPGTTVRVRVTADRDRVQVVVADDGPGLSPAERAKATQRFWRAARDGNGAGTGLGLAIAERLVTARSGSLRLLPNEPTGLVVHVELPRHGPPVQDPTRELADDTAHGTAHQPADDAGGSR